MFTFPNIGALSEPHAVEALQAPAQDEGVRWTNDALSRVLEVTERFPYFLQEFGKRAWDVADSLDQITLDDVERTIRLAIAELDDGFFQVRTGSISTSERAYLRAMAELGFGPVRSSDVAATLGKDRRGVGRSAMP